MSRSFKKLTLVVLLAVAVLTLSGMILAQAVTPFVLQAALPAENKSYSSYNAIGLDGDTAVVGYFGRAEVYTRSGMNWTLQATLSLTPSNQAFGENVALDGDTIAVSSREADGASVYIFSRSGTTWTQVQRLTSSFPKNSGFGTRMALDGNTLLVTSYDELLIEYPDGGEALTFVGAVDVFVFDGTQWNLQTRLDPVEDVSDFADYAWSVEIKGDLAFVTAQTLKINNTPTTPEGAVMIFQRNGTTWIQQSTLVSTVSRERFGSSIDFDGTTLLVGATAHPPEQRGAVYFFVNNGAGWVQQAKIIGNTEPDSFFGLQVAIEDDTALVSPRATFNGITKPGGIRVFKRQGGAWIEEQVLLDLDGTLLATDTHMHMDGKTAMIVYYPYVRLYNFDTVPIPNLLVNGGFETDADNNAIPDGWSRKNTLEDIRQCNESEKLVAYIGNCAYRFKGGTGANRKLAQNVDLNVHDLNVGDRLRLNGFYNKQSSGDLFVWLFVSYAGLSNDQARIKLTRPTTTYQSIDTVAITLKGEPTRIRVEYVNATTSGRTYLDGLSLTKTSTSASVLTLPDTLALPSGDQTLSLSEVETHNTP
jgi:hypothetical protein